ncbi:MAG: M48 family metallopeptidase [Deltaproteobacteria bacterium]|nr:M48 family metallopeptidase [Deltaproteobacteria bacterium]
MIETSSIQFGGTRIDYVVHRTSRVKTVSVAVDPDDGVVLAAPRNTSIDRLDRIVKAKARWIVVHLRRASDRPPPLAKREFVSGETFLYAGRQHLLRVVIVGDDDDEGAVLDHGRLVVRVGARDPIAVRQQLVRWYRGRAAERLPDLVRRWSVRTGLVPSKVSLVEQRRRWGSCSPSGELRLNWRIVGASKRVLEYVVAHELVHLRHVDHTPRFWRALAMMMPDYEVRRAVLRDVGPRLVW